MRNQCGQGVVFPRPALSDEGEILLGLVDERQQLVAQRDGQATIVGGRGQALGQRGQVDLAAVPARYRQFR